MVALTPEKLQELEMLEQSDPVALEIDERVDAEYEYKQWKYEEFLKQKYDPLVDHLIIDKGRKALWDVVEETIKFLYKYQREPLKQLLAEIKEERARAKNEFGAGVAGLRHLGAVPEELEQLIQRAFVDEINVRTRKFRREFFKRYPQFRIAERI